MMGRGDEVIMTSASNPEVMAICYAQGWCASADKMTKTEAEAVTNIGTAFRSSNIVHFDELQYFTNVTRLVGYAFYGCTALVQIDVRNILDFGAQCFQNSLVETLVLNDNAVVRSYAFYSCARLVSLSLPSSLTYINSHICYSCQRLELSTLPSGVTGIGALAFERCYAITNFTLPSGVTSIGSRAFRDTKNLSTLTCLASTAPSIQEDTFANAGISASNKVLYVPSGASGYDRGYWLDLQITNGFTLQYI